MNDQNCKNNAGNENERDRARSVQDAQNRKNQKGNKNTQATDLRVEERMPDREDD